MIDRVRPEAAKYKTTNCKRYNLALKARGALMRISSHLLKRTLTYRTEARTGAFR